MVKANNKVAAKKGANAVERPIQKPVSKDQQKQKVAKAVAAAHVVAGKPSKKEQKPQKPIDEDVDSDDESLAEDDSEDEQPQTKGRPGMFTHTIFFVGYVHSMVLTLVFFFFVISCAENRLTGVSVFVGNLPASIKRVQLEKLFKPHAKVLRIRFRKPNGGQLFKVKRTSLASLIAFVDVATQEEAKIASAALHQQVYQGKVLRVSSDKWENESGNDKRTVFVGNLTYCKYLYF